MDAVSGQLRRAGTAADLFLNPDQQAQAAYDKRDYKSAMAEFKTDYRRGVAAYRAGAYDKAEALFRAAAGKNNDLNALYNLGNAQLMQFRPQDAIASYEAVLRRRPGDVSAQHNLAIAREMLAQQQQKPDQKKKSNQSKQNNTGRQNKNKRNDENQSNRDQRNDAQHQSQTENQGKSREQQHEKRGQAQQQASRQPTSSQSEKQDGQDRQIAGRGNNASLNNRAGGPANALSSTNDHGRSLDIAARHAQLDVNADQWLNRIHSDPGSFLRNQFILEERESANRQQ